MTESRQLLVDYAESRPETVFRELASRDVNTPQNTIFTMFSALREGDQSKLEQVLYCGPGSQALDQLILPRDDWEKISAIQAAGTV